MKKPKPWLSANSPLIIAIGTLAALVTIVGFISGSFNSIFGDKTESKPSFLFPKPSDTVISKSK